MAINRAEAGGSTSAFDALYAALSLRESGPSRCLTLLFTDGLDNTDWITSNDVLTAVQQSDTVVYGIGTDKQAAAGFKSIAEETGGEALVASSTRQLRELFVRTVREMQARYLLTYYPQGVPRPGWHNLSVRLAGASGQVRARRRGSVTRAGTAVAARVAVEGRRSRRPGVRHCRAMPSTGSVHPAWQWRAAVPGGHPPSGASRKPVVLGYHVLEGAARRRSCLPASTTPDGRRWRRRSSTDADPARPRDLGRHRARRARPSRGRRGPRRTGSTSARRAADAHGRPRRRRRCSSRWAAARHVLPCRASAATTGRSTTRRVVRSRRSG